MATRIRIREAKSQHSEGDLRGAIHDAMISEGVLGVDHFVVSANSPADLNVLVDPGILYILNDAYTELNNEVKFWELILDTQAELAISANSSGSTRIDIICGKIDVVTAPNSGGTNIGSILVVEGTPGAGVPATPANHIKLAEITVLDSTPDIATEDIADTRTFIRFKPSIKVNGVENYAPSGGGTATLDLDLSNTHDVDFPAGNISIDFENGVIGQYFIVKVTQDGVGGRTLTWTPTINWITSGGSEPSVANGANDITVYGFRKTAVDEYDGYLISNT